MERKQRKKQLANIRPSKVQLDWQEVEFYSFFHFGMNTFTGREWGDGVTSPKVFHPTNFDARQWIRTVKKAGMKGVILTCKHHDGFCMWPSQYTDYSVKSSDWKDGKGDVVKEVSQACLEEGIKFGFYLSPWDMHEQSYGTPEYNQYFRNQLTELLTNYGEVFSVWFDGACGEGPNGKRQKYDWSSYYDLIRELQPNAAISISGPDVRWIGNEAGHTRREEWSVVPKHLFDQDKIREHSQSEDDTNFRENFDATDDDLGSFELVKDEKEMIWWPAEVDVSIRPGWFYHEEEDEKVRSLANLMDIYFHAVGGNATLLLNIPPNKEGLIAKEDEATLLAMGEEIQKFQRENLVAEAKLSTTSTQKDEVVIDFTKTRNEGYWCAKEDDDTATITAKWAEKQTFTLIELCEHLPLGQRIEQFEIAMKNENGEFERIYTGYTVGYKKICQLEQPVTTDELEIRILSSRWYPTLSYIGVYDYDNPVLNE
ncbi:alpha-L-fucosidase [Pilibacter termitis]|uniref:alpha-L-fucosidase n=1 Tax=Pilibacter termitis TaxID=263852 RepID=A0A1T4QN96_9ENTE|nr:alpha-L-fucosidase [Pilibacter termitis]SKA05166.1 alpha-L-fucosidase [Pilibacter termitis]